MVLASWRSREHFSVPRSSPEFQSADVEALARAARSVGGRSRSNPVIAESLQGNGWALRYFASQDGLREITRAQARKYEAVRAGNARWSSTMNPVPPISETAITTINLDGSTTEEAARSSTPRSQGELGPPGTRLSSKTSFSGNRKPNGRNADPAVVAEKQRRIRAPHVAPLNQLADRIADALEIPRGHVPYVDPDLAGIRARALVLLDNPSTKAEAGSGSGLLSLDNNDRTARNCREAYERHGVRSSEVVHWNVVPFPVGNPNGGSTARERRAAVQWTRDFVGLCPDIEIVLLLGTAARDGWKLADLDHSKLIMVPGETPHCSDQGLNSVNGRARFEAAVAYLARHLDSSRPSVHD